MLGFGLHVKNIDIGDDLQNKANKNCRTVSENFKQIFFEPDSASIVNITNSTQERFQIDK